MAKVKKNKIQVVQAKESVNVVDFAKTQSFLNSAISDISGYIKFFDTKVSIIMSALGVIISGIISCRQIIYDTYKSIETNSLLHVFFCILILIFAINVVFVYCWGILTIRAHVCNIGFKSLWFIKDKKEAYPFEAYKADVEKMTTQDIVDTLAAESYKLNDIYRQKASTTKKTVASFAAALIVIFIIMCICIFINVK